MTRLGQRYVVSRDHTDQTATAQAGIHATVVDLVGDGRSGNGQGRRGDGGISRHDVGADGVVDAVLSGHGDVADTDVFVLPCAWINEIRTVADCDHIRVGLQTIVGEIKGGVDLTVIGFVHTRGRDGQGSGRDGSTETGRLGQNIIAAVGTADAVVADDRNAATVLGNVLGDKIARLDQGGRVTTEDTHQSAVDERGGYASVIDLIEHTRSGHAQGIWIHLVIGCGRETPEAVVCGIVSGECAGCSLGVGAYTQACVVTVVEWVVDRGYCADIIVAYAIGKRESAW